MPTSNKPIIDITNINEKIYDFLKQRIIDYAYPPGHKINVNELRKELGVSRTPLKDALFRLSGEGLVDISSRCGTFVKAVTDEDVIEIFDIRLIIEPSVAEMVAPKITAGQIKKLKKIYEESLIIDDDESYGAFLNKSSAFHTEIIHFTNNNKLLKIYKNLNIHMHFLRYRFAQHATTRLAGTNKEHYTILKSFENGDPKAAKKATEDHLLNAKELFLKGP